LCKFPNGYAKITLCVCTNPSEIQAGKRTKIVLSTALGVVAIAAMTVAGVYYWAAPGKKKK
jgi:hypothetical protein